MNRLILASLITLALYITATTRSPISENRSLGPNVQLQTSSTLRQFSL